MNVNPDCDNCERLRNELEEWKTLTSYWRRKYGEIARQILDRAEAKGIPLRKP